MCTDSSVPESYPCCNTGGKSEDLGDVAALKSPDKPNVQKQNWLFSFTLESKTRSSSQLYQVDVLLAMPEGDVRTLTTPKDGEVE